MSIFKKKTAGEAGEDIACRYLRKKGYKIICRNYRFSHLETDIICKHRDYLVFVEVKTRTDGDESFGDMRPASAVDFEKRKNLRRCAEAYIYKNDIKSPIRLDVIEVYLQKGARIRLSDKGICHIENAF